MPAIPSPLRGDGIAGIKIFTFYRAFLTNAEVNCTMIIILNI